jgi:predicted RNase H-like HicB family nuclease
MGVSAITGHKTLQMLKRYTHLKAEDWGKRLNQSGGIMWNVEWEQETDGRWIAEIPIIPGVMAYGTTKEEAIRSVEILALKVLAERLERGEDVREIHSLFHAV